MIALGWSRRRLAPNTNILLAHGASILSPAKQAEWRNVSPCGLKGRDNRAGDGNPSHRVPSGRLSTPWQTSRGMPWAQG